MIPKGLKVGDTFKQGNAVFEVTGIDGEDYFCKRVGATPSFAEVDQPKKSVVKEEVKEDYLSMPYAQLKKLCAERGLDATGKKEDLIARLEDK